MQSMIPILQAATATTGSLRVVVN